MKRLLFFLSLLWLTSVEAATYVVLPNNAHATNLTVVGGTTSGLTNTGGTFTSATITGGSVASALTGTNAVLTTPAITGGTNTGSIITGATISGGSVASALTGTNAVLTTPAITGGTNTSSIINGATISGGSVASALTGTNAVLTTPAITGGTNTSSIITGATITGGSVASALSGTNAVLTTPAITGGTNTSSIINGATISGGSVASALTGTNAVLTTPSITGGTNSSPFFTGTSYSSGSLLLTNTGDVLTIGNQAGSIYGLRLRGDNNALTTYPGIRSGGSGAIQIEANQTAGGKVYLAQDNTAGVVLGGGGGNVQIGKSGDGTHLVYVGTNASYASGYFSIMNARASGWAMTGAGTSANYFKYLNDGGYGLILDSGSAASSSTYTLALAHNGTFDFWLQGDGNLGLSTTSPRYTLDVNGVIQSRSTSGGVRQYTGSATNQNRMIGVVQTITTTVANTGNTETNLMTSTFPAAGLAATGDTVEILIFGTTAANGNSKTVAAYFGATKVVQSAAFTTSAAAWRITGTITRTGATTQVACVTCFVDGATPVTTYTAPAETLSGTVTIKATGTGAANSDITQVFQRTIFQPANP